MWREYGVDGYLVNSFADTVAALKPMYALRVLGGLFYLGGGIILVYNVWMTILGKLREETPMNIAEYDPVADRPITAVPAE